MNIATDASIDIAGVAFAVKPAAIKQQPDSNAPSPKSTPQAGVTLAGPGVVGGGIPLTSQPAIPQIVSPSAPPVPVPAGSPEQQPLLDRALNLLKEIVETAVGQLFQFLQDGISQMLDVLLDKMNLARDPISLQTPALSADGTASPAAERVIERDQTSSAETVGSLIDGIATAANLLVLGRGALSAAGRLKGTVVRGAKSVAAMFEKTSQAPELLRSVGAKLKAAFS